MTEFPDTLLQMRSIDKRFPGVHALRGVDFDVRRGEVHALMGQNGAGKSTLIKVLTGVYARDGGAITFDGRDFTAASPADAQRQGISTIYQEVNLIPTLSVTENLVLNRWPRRWWGIDWNEARHRAKSLLAKFGLDVDVGRTLGDYSVAVRQMVAVARAVAADARLIVMDEPTSSLDDAESQRLFDTIRRLKTSGVGVVFVTHFLDQVYQISDRITVLRNGERVATHEAALLPRIDLIRAMLGSDMTGVAPCPSPTESRAQQAQPTPAARPSAILCAKGLGRHGMMHPFDLELAAGEIVGLAGLLGSGRTETARLLFGADRADSGSVLIAGRRVVIRSSQGSEKSLVTSQIRETRMCTFAPRQRRSPRDAIAAGLALCPEDRRADGLVPHMSVRDNIALVVQRSLSRFGLVSRRAHARIADEFIRRMGIVTASLDSPVRNLSGGNQQKVILARWLANRPMLLILDEPTRGIDVGAKAEIERTVRELAGAGMSVVFISSEFAEVVRASQRVYVLRDRRFVAELRGPEVSEHGIAGAIASPGGAQ